MTSLHFSPLMLRFFHFYIFYSSIGIFYAKHFDPISIHTLTFIRFVLVLMTFTSLQCYSLGVQDLSSLSAEEIHTPGSYLVIFNGLILGKHEAPKVYIFLYYYLCVISINSFIVLLMLLACYLQRFANAMRSLRRSGKIGEFVSIYVNDKQVIFSYFFPS